MKILSSIDGRIAQLAFATNETTQVALSSYKVLLHTFLPAVSIVMLVKPDAPIPASLADMLRATWADMLRESGRDPATNPFFILSSDARPIRRWIQDPFLVLCDVTGQSRSLLHPNANPDSERYVKEFAAALNWQMASAGVNFEGGNVLFVADVLLLGKDILTRQRLSGSGEALDDVPERLRAACGAREVRLLGGSARRQMMPQEDKCYQPFFHIDLYLSPGGRDVQGRPVMVLAEIRDEFVVGGKRPRNWVELRANLEAALEETWNQLVEAGFAVHRIPIVLAIDAMGYTVYSFNNMKVEAYDRVRRAYLPDYSLATVNQELIQALIQGHEQAAQVLATLGFEVQPVRSALLALTSKARGSLHCIAKVLQRETNSDPTESSLGHPPHEIRQ
jgi:hypothetical protein